MLANTGITGVMREQAIIVTLAASLLTGCGGYFSNQWPNLAEGFSDAAERDAALAELESEPEEVAEPAAVPSEIPEDAVPTVPAVAPTPAPVDPPMINLAPEEVLNLAMDFDAASEQIEAARRAYLEAKAAIRGGANEGAKGRWLTAQLKLTGLSRAAGLLAPILAELPAVDICGAEDADGGADVGEACALVNRVEEKNAGLAGYLDAERRSLTSYDPGDP